MLARAAFSSTAAIVLAAWMPAWGVASPGLDPTAPPATLSPLDPIRLAADFAPARAALAADAEPGAAPADPLPPVMRRLQDEFALESDEETARSGSDDDTPSIAVPIAGAILGGAIGFVGGALVGGTLTSQPQPDWYDDEAAVIGSVIGEVVCMPIGAHLAYGSRGSLGAAAGGSLVGVLLAVGLSAFHPAAAILGVGVQVALTVAGELRSAEQKAAERAAEAPGRSSE